METVYPVIGAAYPNILIDQAKKAKRSIDILAFVWKPLGLGDDTGLSGITRAIANAKARGVFVRVLTESVRSTLDLNALGIPARTFKRRSLLHAKLLIFDRSTILLGSHNLTEAAFSQNQECSALFTLPTQDNEYALYFDRLWQL